MSMCTLSTCPVVVGALRFKVLGFAFLHFRDTATDHAAKNRLLHDYIDGGHQAG